MQQTTQTDQPCSQDQLCPSTPWNLEYEVGEDGNLAAKTETIFGVQERHRYSFDRVGHLTEVFRNGALAEEYEYNEQGQRIRSYSAGLGSTNYQYDSKGQLLSSGDTQFKYDARGNLALRQESSWYVYEGRKTVYEYDHTRLKRVTLPTGDVIRYEYSGDDTANPVGPARKYRNDVLVMEYKWLDLVRLGSCMDYEQGFKLDFEYDEGIYPVGLGISIIQMREHSAKATLGRQALLQEGANLFGNSPKYNDRGWLTQNYLIHCDQVGTPKLLTFTCGKKVQGWQYDSFGNLIEESRYATVSAGHNGEACNQRLHLPIGFAGGLHDRDTGLVRFGFRDYDPSVGRFTCPDPIGDTGGDHDLYDYCVDDPVSCIDPLGLWTKETFNEECVSRDERGRFDGGGNCSSSKDKSRGLGDTGSGSAKEIFNRMTGNKPISKMQNAASAADFLEWAFTGQYTGRASKGLNEALPKVKERSIDAAKQIGPNFLETWDRHYGGKKK